LHEHVDGVARIASKARPALREAMRESAIEVRDDWRDDFRDSSQTMGWPTAKMPNPTPPPWKNPDGNLHEYLDKDTDAEIEYAVWPHGGAMSLAHIAIYSSKRGGGGKRVSPEQLAVDHWPGFVNQIDNMIDKIVRGW
ncbi:MAG: hypothetical protein FWG25_11250, partial [Promicromonosporaceae bacterium]|nr:hypothetical protein [Promicromonosporaceae bacterium]